MLYGSSAILFAVMATLLVGETGARAFDDSKYPNWKGQWSRFNTNPQGQAVKFDPSKPSGLGQEAPLTPEYQKVLENSMADQAAGGLGNYPSARCYLGGMPRTMSPSMQEYVITPETTYILTVIDLQEVRRVFTDGRDWPAEIEPSYLGYSIGRWIDEEGQGRYTTLEVETRGFKGPRAFDHTGLPMHFDNQSIFKERFHLDKADPSFLHDEITVIDHALTRPWTVDKKYKRSADPRPTWLEYNCAEGNEQIVVGKENYFLSADGFLMPARKDQAPPDLRYFKKPQTGR
ncbi:MAG TPA: hypothetical protein VKW08_13735 [Xanthobacteraceae bacterium]|nr:hypothetical protein [Xanthobacteraceae bacterium]